MPTVTINRASEAAVQHAQSQRDDNEIDSTVNSTRTVNLRNDVTLEESFLIS